MRISRLATSNKRVVAKQKLHADVAEHGVADDISLSAYVEGNNSLHFDRAVIKNYIDAIDTSTSVIIHSSSFFLNFLVNINYIYSYAFTIKFLIVFFNCKYSFSFRSNRLMNCNPRVKNLMALMLIWKYL